VPLCIKVSSGTAARSGDRCTRVRLSPRVVTRKLAVAYVLPSPDSFPSIYLAKTLRCLHSSCSVSDREPFPTQTYVFIFHQLLRPEVKHIPAAKLLHPLQPHVPLTESISSFRPKVHETPTPVLRSPGYPPRLLRSPSFELSEYRS